MQRGGVSGWAAVGYGLGGGFERDREEKRKELQLQAAQHQMQFNKEGNLEYIPGSEKSLQAEQFKMLAEGLQELQTRFVQKDTWDAVQAGIEDGHYKGFNEFLSSNPTIKDMYAKQGIQSIETFDPYNDDHLAAYQQVGVNPDVIQYLKDSRDGKIEGMKEQEIRDVAKSLGVAYPLVRQTDNNLNVVSLQDFVSTTGLIKQARGDKKRQAYLDAIAMGQKALTGVTQRAYEASVAAVEAQTKSVEATAGMEQLKLEDAQKFLESNPTASLADYLAKYNKSKVAGEGMKPFSIQEAEYFGGLKSKVVSGTASPEEAATYDAYLTKIGGSASARDESLSRDVTKLSNQGVDVNDPNINVNSLNPQQKEVALKVTRQLERTQAGKTMVSNIAGILEKDLGAVGATADKLSSLALDDKVSTSLVTEQINRAKAYLPTSFREMSEADLKDANFRQAYLSASAVFLKLQSGLTVSDREAERFAGSFGTLSKNEKVNMVGLKTKLDEVIGAYEANSQLEPTLYNLKYKNGISKMKNISDRLDNYINGVPQSTPTLTDKDRQSLDAIFGGR